MGRQESKAIGPNCRRWRGSMSVKGKPKVGALLMIDQEIIEKQKSLESPLAPAWGQSNVTPRLGTNGIPHLAMASYAWMKSV